MLSFEVSWKNNINGYFVVVRSFEEEVQKAKQQSLVLQKPALPKVVCLCAGGDAWHTCEAMVRWVAQTFRNVLETSCCPAPGNILRKGFRI